MNNNEKKFDAGPMYISKLPKEISALERTGIINENIIIDDESLSYLYTTYLLKAVGQRFAINTRIEEISGSPLKLIIWLRPSVDSAATPEKIKELEKHFGKGNIVVPTKEMTGIVHEGNDDKELQKIKSFGGETAVKLFRSAKYKGGFSIKYSFKNSKHIYDLCNRSTRQYTMQELTENPQHAYFFNPDIVFHELSKSFKGKKYSLELHLDRSAREPFTYLILNAIKQKFMEYIAKHHKGLADSNSISFVIKDDKYLKIQKEWEKNIRYNKIEFTKSILKTLFIALGYNDDSPGIFWPKKTDLQIAFKVIEIAKINNIQLDFNSIPELYSTHQLSMLMLAAKRKDETSLMSLIMMLVEGGADLNLRDRHGHDAIWYAQEAKNESIVNYLSTALKLHKAIQSKDILEIKNYLKNSEITAIIGEKLAFKWSLNTKNLENIAAVLLYQLQKEHSSFSEFDFLLNEIKCHRPTSIQLKWILKNILNEYKLSEFQEEISNIQEFLNEDKDIHNIFDKTKEILLQIKNNNFKEIFKLFDQLSLLNNDFLSIKLSFNYHFKLKDINEPELRAAFIRYIMNRSSILMNNRNKLFTDSIGNQIIFSNYMIDSDISPVYKTRVKTLCFSKTLISDELYKYLWKSLIRDYISSVEEINLSQEMTDEEKFPLEFKKIEEIAICLTESKIEQAFILMDNIDVSNLKWASILNDMYSFIDDEHKDFNILIEQYLIKAHNEDMEKDPLVMEEWLNKMIFFAASLPDEEILLNKIIHLKKAPITLNQAQSLLKVALHKNCTAKTFENLLYFIKEHLPLGRDNKLLNNTDTLNEQTLIQAIKNDPFNEFLYNYIAIAVTKAYSPIDSINIKKYTQEKQKWLALFPQGLKLNSWTHDTGIALRNPLLLSLNYVSRKARGEDTQDGYFNPMLSENISTPLLKFCFEVLFSNKNKMSTTEAKFDKEKSGPLSIDSMKNSLERCLMYLAKERVTDEKNSMIRLIHAAQEQGISLNLNFTDMPSRRTPLSYCLDLNSDSTQEIRSKKDKQIQALFYAGADLCILDESKKIPMDYDTMGLGLKTIIKLLENHIPGLWEKCKKFMEQKLQTPFDGNFLEELDQTTDEPIIFTMIDSFNQWIAPLIGNITLLLGVCADLGGTLDKQRRSIFHRFLIKPHSHPTDSQNWQEFKRLNLIDYPVCEWKIINPQLHQFIMDDFIAEILAGNKNKIDEYKNISDFDVNYRNLKTGLTLLDLAISCSNLLAIQLLLDWGSNPNNICPLTGRNALGYLITYHNQKNLPNVKQMAKLLLEAKVNPDLIDLTGQTAYQDAGTELREIIEPYSKPPVSSLSQSFLVSLPSTQNQGPTASANVQTLT